ncbi:MAG: hypothetical protein FJ297_16825 [Planctomycetes bacterium]|nr:hypothetical protein [Planctomycetota bacterium]
MSALKVKFDFEILPGQRAPLVDQRLSFIDKLRDKIREQARRSSARTRLLRSYLDDLRADYRELMFGPVP